MFCCLSRRRPNAITPPFYQSPSVLSHVIWNRLHLSFHKRNQQQHDIIGNYVLSIFAIGESGIGTSLPNKWTQCLRVLLIFLFICFVKEGVRAVVFRMMEILRMGHFLKSAADTDAQFCVFATAVFCFVFCAGEGLVSLRGYR